MKLKCYLKNVKLLFHSPLNLSFVLISLAIPVFMVIGGPWAEKPTLKGLQILCVLSCSCLLLFFLMPLYDSKSWDNYNPMWRALLKFLEKLFLFATGLSLFSYLAFYYIGKLT